MRYRLRAPSGQVLEEGEGEARVTGDALVVTPRLGQPLRIRPADVRAVAEPQPWVLEMTLAEGPVLELAQMGSLRTQILAEFTQARQDDTVRTLLLAGVGTPTSFTGAVDEVPAEVRLYDDALVALPQSGEPQQILYSFVEDVATDRSGYRITVSATGRRPLDVHRLASRTSEFVDLLRSRVSGARTRSAALVAGLLPGLGSLGQRSVAGMLRDGIPARAADLDTVEPTISAALLRVCTRADRVDCVRLLAQRGALWLALHQRSSVEVAASGHADLGAREVDVMVDHGGATAAPGGFAGVLAGEMLGAGPDPFGLLSGPGAFGGGGAGGMAELAVLGGMAGGGTFGGGMFGGGMFGGGSGAPAHQPQPRQAPKPLTGLQTGYTDYDKLGVAGDAPTVLAACFAEVGDAVVYEVLNDADHATYVYDRPPGGVPELAAAIALIGYRVSAIYSQAGVDSSLRDAVARLPHLAALRSGFRGRAIHTEGWPGQLDGLLRR